MSELIASEIRSRDITRLCHFTKTNKLLHILTSEDGIVANTFLEDVKETLQKNDEKRYDNKEDHICCSVQYTNAWYLRRIRESDPVFKDWVVIFIDPLIMLDDTTYFCYRNAAANFGALVSKGEQAFSKMFAQVVQGQYTITRPPRMLPNSTTDGQAEVLIYKNIPREKITGIAVPNEDQAKILGAIFTVLTIPDIPIIISPDLFSDSWNRKVKQGQPINEYVYEGELL
ncbi:DarT ssDNA thymidine ADP-ribosyltransferase family protein [Solibacillus sp. FSL K6-1554]|uniref:DarT ssDNA thymidine ADP-ribosyltransferase family protein n=1 Tax=Solibacillus sp. FSL K6-1554 TaxID=2921472 RepID=UPI0030F5A347